MFVVKSSWRRVRCRKHLSHREGVWRFVRHVQATEKKIILHMEHT